MTFSVVANTNTTGTSGGINTTGADLIVAVLTGYGGTQTFSDNKGNIYTPLTLQDSIIQTQAKLWYVEAPAVGSGHTFTIGGTQLFGLGAIAAFSGSLGSGAYDQESGATWSSGTSKQPGSITGPSGALYVTGFGGYVDSLTVDGGFTANLVENVAKASGTNYATGLAWLGSSSAQDPTWSWAGAGFDGGGVVMATFSPITGGGGVTYPQLERGTRGMFRGMHATPYPTLRRSKGGVLYRDPGLLRAA